MKLSRYLSTFLLAIILPLGLSLGWLFKVYIDDRLRDEHQALLATADLVRVDVERQLESGFAAAQSLASRRWSTPCSDTVLGEQLLTLPAYSNITLLNADGRVVCAARPVTAAAENQFRQFAFFSSLRGAQRAWLGPPVISPTTAERVSYLVVPVMRSGRKVGSVVLALRLSAVSLPMLPEPQPWIKLVSADGVELLGEDTGRKLSPPLMAWFGQSRSREGDVSIDGSRHRVVRAPVSGGQWTVVAAISERSLWLGVCRAFIAPAAVILLALLVSASAGGYLVVAMGRSLGYLQRMAARLGSERQGRDEPLPAELKGAPGEFSRMAELLGNAARQFQSVFNASTDGIFLCDERLQICSVNEAGASMFGYTVSDLLGQPISVLVPESQREAHDHLARQYQTYARSRLMGLRPMLKGRRRDGSEFPLQVTLQPISTEEGCFISATVVDLSRRHELEQRIQYLSQYDMLTGLPNRGLLIDRLRQSLIRAEQSGDPLAVVRVYLNRFKSINDTYGHHEGDALLVEVARRLREAAGPLRSVARLGGAEFAVLADADGGEDVLVTLIDAVRRAVEAPLPLAGKDINLAAAIGVASFPVDGTGSEELIKQAGLALQEARSAPGGALRFYSREQEVQVRARLDMESAIRVGLDSGQFRFFYQPVVDMRTSRIVGAEALLRWMHPERGPVSPVDVLPVAEAMGVLPTLEWQLRERFFQEAAAWVAEFGPLALAFNVSATEFSRMELVGDIADQLTRSGLPASSLVLELTESALMQHPEDAAVTMEALCRLGVTLAIDDFGTGYSSLSYLQSFPASRLKIDRSFVSRLGQDPSAPNIISAIISLAGNLGMAVVAEGVETELQRAHLLELGCPSGQGYLWSPAVAADGFTEQLRQCAAAGERVSP